MKKKELLQHLIKRKRGVVERIQALRPVQYNEDLYVATGAIGELRALNDEALWLDDLIRRTQSKVITV